MKFDWGLSVVVVAMGLFYLRLIQLRGKRKREAREEALERLRTARKRKPGDAPVQAVKERPMFQVASWWLVGGGAIIMLAGLALRTSPGILPVLEPFWWLVTAAGVVIFTFSLK